MGHLDPRVTRVQKKKPLIIREGGYFQIIFFTICFFSFQLEYVSRFFTNNSSQSFEVLTKLDSADASQTPNQPIYCSLCRLYDLYHPIALKRMIEVGVSVGLNERFLGKFQLQYTSVSQVLYLRTLTDTEKMRPDIKILKTESKTLIDPRPQKYFCRLLRNFCSHRNF